MVISGSLPRRTVRAAAVLSLTCLALSGLYGQSQPPTEAEDPLVRQALSAALSGNRLELQNAWKLAVAREQAAGDQRPLRTSEAMNYLFNCTLRNREQFLLGQELALADARSEEFRASILWSLLSDEYYELALLKGENRFNRFTRLFNRTSSAVSRMALFQPQAAAQLLLDAVHVGRKGRMPTDRERRMVYLGRTFLDKHPEAPEAREVRELLAQLGRKLDAERAHRDKLAGQSMLEGGRPQTAEFHLERAVLLAPNDRDAREALEKARKARDEMAARAARAMAVSTAEGQLGPADLQVLELACRALMRRDGHALSAAGSQSKALKDSVIYALACLTERNGYHQDALQRLDNLARSMPDTPGGRAATAALANPSYHLERAFDDAMARFKKRQREFILSGNRTREDTVFALSDAALQAPSQAAVGLPALFFTDVLVRGVAERFRSHVAADEAVDAGARLLARWPESPRAREVAAQVAELARRGGDLDRAEVYQETAGGDPETDMKLREERARALLRQAMDSPDFVQRKRLLEEAARTYPDTRVAATVARELAKLPPTLEPGSIVLIPKMLERDPRLAAALGVAPELVDGKKSNGELADEGLAIDGRGEKAAWRLRDGDTFYTVPIPEASREQILAAARQLRASYARSEAGKQKGKNRWFPFSIEGGAGAGGVEVAPKVQPYQDDPDRMRLFRP